VSAAVELPDTSGGIGGGRSWPLLLGALLLFGAAAIGAIRRRVI
jgi:hypothetical protein